MASYFLISMMGSFVKELYDSINSEKKISFKRIFVSSILATFLVLSFRNYLHSDVFIAVTFILGIIGWELFSRICTIDGLKKTIFDFNKLKNSILNSNNNDTEKK